MPCGAVKISLFEPPTPSVFAILFTPVNALAGNAVAVHVDVVPKSFFVAAVVGYAVSHHWYLSNSSVMRWNPGKLDYLWNEFVNNPARVMQQNHGDQDWITKRARQDINHWPDEWIRSYKWEMIGLKDTKLLSKDGKSFFRTPPTITEGNKVAVFHGRPNPMECADEWVVKNWV